LVGGAGCRRRFMVALIRRTLWLMPQYCRHVGHLAAETVTPEPKTCQVAFLDELHSGKTGREAKSRFPGHVDHDVPFVRSCRSPPRCLCPATLSTASPFRLHATVIAPDNVEPTRGSGSGRTFWSQRSMTRSSSSSIGDDIVAVELVIGAS